MSTTSDQLSPAELDQLRAVLEGYFDAPVLRRRLWRSWGLCPHHSWWSAVIDCELRRQPFLTSLLCDELLGRAVAQLGLPLVLPRRRVLGLTPLGPCPVCETVALAGANRGAPGGRSDHARPGAWQWADRVHQAAVIGELVSECATEWRRRSCPVCLGGEGPPCRAHILAERDLLGPRDLRRSLIDIQDRLLQLTRSVTGQHAETTMVIRASWVEAVGWLAGWRFLPRTVISGGTGE